MSGDNPFTDLMIRSKTSALRRLHSILENDGIVSRAAFSDMMSAAFSYGGLELRALSDNLGFSFYSVLRWQLGRSVPHPSLWPTVADWVMERIAERIIMNEIKLAKH